MAKTVRVGIIGAGNFTKRRSVPNLLALPDVEVVGIANRSMESSEAVCKEFGIPHAFDDWRKLIDSGLVDAVVVGSPPHIHRDIAVAAFDAGIDMLCQTRFATTVGEAREMAAKARATGRKGMVFPPDPYFEVRGYVKHLLSTNYVGKVRQVMCFCQSSEMADVNAPLGRRNDPSMYNHPNYLGLYWDCLRPWFGDATRVLADARIFTAERARKSDGARLKSVIPEATTVISETESGALITQVQSDATWFGKNQVEIYGEQGALVITRNGILGARMGDKELAPITVPEDWLQHWEVEREFVDLVRGTTEFAGPTFEDGVKNIEYLEAAKISSAEGRWVDLPLP